MTFGVDAGADASQDAAAGADAGLDAGADAGMDAGMDAGSDAGPDDAGPGDAGPGDAGPDLGPPEMCGAGPACGTDEVCWGEGCSCVVEIDGDSYLRPDGRVVYARATPSALAETAPGVPLENITEIMDGWRHTCGLRDDGTVWCWAKNSSAGQFGELGDGVVGTGRTPLRAVQVMIDASTPLTGVAHLNNRYNSRCYIDITTCAIQASDGAVHCWGGDNSGGGTGSFYTQGSVGTRAFATPLEAAVGMPLTGVTQIALGLRHACALDAAGQVSCWGMNVGGPLGVGDQSERRFPTAVDLRDPVSGDPLVADEIGVGGDFSCARSGDGVYCWGATGTGSVGYTTDIAGESDGCINFCELTPAQVIDTSAGALRNVRRLEVNYLSACAILDDDTLRCWGQGVGNVATEPTFPGGVAATDVVATTSCSSVEIDSGAIRYMQRDGTLVQNVTPLALLCPGAM
ncbi:MAG: hypothetical protein AAF447_21475 [Myxococcota bacterium]